VAAAERTRLEVQNDKSETTIVKVATQQTAKPAQEGAIKVTDLALKTKEEAKATKEKAKGEKRSGCSQSWHNSIAH
jgi:hypothetical protein